jgi:hypothetical protein
MTSAAPAIRAGPPHWTGQSTLLLPVPPEAWPPPAEPLRLDGIDFVPKAELHVTVVGRRLGAELREAMARDAAFAAAVESAIAGTDWSFARRPDWWRLLARTAGRRRHSIIQRVALPAMAPFHARLGARLGRALPVPPPHVTLYTAGDARGIGLPDEATLRRCIARPLDAGELGAAARAS